MSQVCGRRNRAANYTPDEKRVLLDIILKRRHIVDNKKTGGASWREKEACWETIWSEFNSQCPSGIYRTVKSLREFYFNYKKLQRSRENTSRVNPAEKGYADNSEDSGASLDIKEEKYYDTSYLTDCYNSEGNESENVADLGYYTSDTAEPETTTPTVENTQKARKWGIYRNRPRFCSSFLSKQYHRLAIAKLQIASKQLQGMKEKNEREKIEFELKKKALQLDVDIKEAILQRVQQMGAQECFNFLNKSV